VLVERADAYALIHPVTLDLLTRLGVIRLGAHEATPDFLALVRSTLPHTRGQARPKLEAVSPAPVAGLEAPAPARVAGDTGATLPASEELAPVLLERVLQLQLQMLDSQREIADSQREIAAVQREHVQLTATGNELTEENNVLAKRMDSKLSMLRAENAEEAEKIKKIAILSFEASQRDHEATHRQILALTSQVPQNSERVLKGLEDVVLEVRRRAAAPSAASGAAAPRPRPVPRVQPAAASRAAQPAAAPRPPRKAAARACGNTTDMLSATTRAAVGVPTAAARRVMGHGATAIPQASRRLPASRLPIARAGTSAPDGVARGRSNTAVRPTTAAVGVQQRHATPARYEPADETPESTLPARHSPARHSTAVGTSSASREMRSPEMLEHEFMHELHSPILDKCLPLPPSSLEA